MSHPTAGTASLFDDVRDARDAAIAEAEEHAAPDWLQTAERIVRDLARTRQPFSTDVVWHLLAGEDAATHEPRALGAVMMRLAKVGVIRKTGAYEPSVRTACHGRPVAMWVGQ